MPPEYRCKSNTFIVKVCIFHNLLHLNKIKLFIYQSLKNIRAGAIKSGRIGIRVDIFEAGNEFMLEIGLYFTNPEKHFHGE